MDEDLVLISHSVCKKRTAAEAQLSPISPNGEFVTTYYTPTTKTKTSKRQKFRSKLLKCFSKSEDSASAFGDTDWTIQLNNNVGNSQMPESLLGSRVHNGSGITMTSNHNSGEENLACSLDKPHDSSNPFYIASISSSKHEAYSSGLAPVFGAQEAYVPRSVNKIPMTSNTSAGRGDQESPKKHRFRIWLNENCPRSSDRKVTMALKDIFAAIAEEAAKFASIRGKSKAAVEAGAVTTAAYARVNAATFRPSFNNGDAAKIIKEACQDVLSVSLVPKWKNIDYVKLFSIYQYELNLREAQANESLRRSSLKSGIDGLTIENSIGETFSEKELEPGRRVQFVNLEEGFEKESNSSALNSECDSPSEAFVEDFESNFLDEGDYALSTRTKKWMNLLMSRIDFFGKTTDIVRTFGDGIDNRSIGTNGMNNQKNLPFELECPNADELDDGFNPCMLDNSLIDALLPHIESGLSPSHRISDEISAAMTTEISTTNPGFCVYFGNASEGSSATLESNFEVKTKKAAEDIGVRTDERNTLESLAFREVATPRDTSFSSCDNHSVDFSKAYLRIEILNSHFDQISSQVEKIVSGAVRDDISNELPLKNYQSPFIAADGSCDAPVPFKNNYSALNTSADVVGSSDRKYSIEDLSPTATADPKMQVKELLSQIDSMLNTTKMGQYQANRENSSTSRENRLHLDIDTEQTIPQIDELLSLIDVAMVPATSENSKIDTQCIPNLNVRDTIIGKAPLDSLIPRVDCRLFDTDCVDSPATKIEDPIDSLSCEYGKQDSTNSGPQVNALLAQIDSVITNFDSND
ncbi:hypothetical protein ZYGR_0P01870 [Zygosaccharomyces rouxii]|uniref:Uncharacterized protein n=1 Tax=Zygosaccharomyces rouxii TaxID=4956 RepID=A0A1Q3A1N0_ZYGRO|nr:hypothetical protein ZYGR_0P01870 [Zygosaccharomyces rouxii]